jgi:hypothetical protein
MRAPLQLALLISPIYLLLPLKLFKKSYNRNIMLAMSSCLGNSKPQVLFDIEMTIWKALCSLASGTVDPFNVLHELSDSLPWDRIQEAFSTDSAKWFNLGTLVFSIKRYSAYIFLAALSPPIPQNSLLLEPSARIETHEPPPTPPSTRPQIPTFANSLASAINLAASTSPLSANPSVLFSSDAQPRIQHSSTTADQLMTEDSLPESDTQSFLPNSSAMSPTDDVEPPYSTTAVFDSLTTSMDAGSSSYQDVVRPSLGNSNDDNDENDNDENDNDDNDNGDNDNTTMAEVTGAEIQQDKTPQKVMKLRGPKLPSRIHEPLDRPRKRKRRKTSRSTKDDSHDDEHHSSSDPTDTDPSDADPTDADPTLHRSIWEPVTFNDLVSLRHFRWAHLILFAGRGHRRRNTSQ